VPQCDGMPCKACAARTWQVRPTACSTLVYCCLPQCAQGFFQFGNPSKSATSGTACTECAQDQLCRTHVLQVAQCEAKLHWLPQWSATRSSAHEEYQSGQCMSHHHHVTHSSHSSNAIGPAPHWSGRRKEHCSIMFANVQTSQAFSRNTATHLETNILSLEPQI
jgi:hypothetical protein